MEIMNNFLDFSLPREKVLDLVEKRIGLQNKVIDRLGKAIDKFNGGENEDEAYIILCHKLATAHYNAGALKTYKNWIEDSDAILICMPRDVWEAPEVW